MKKMKMIVIFIVILVFAFLVGGFFTGKVVKTTSEIHSNVPTINITYQNLAPILSQSSMIQSLPSNSNIALRIGEKEYILAREGVREGKANSDIIISLPEKYLSVLTNTNFCSVIQQANKNRDLGFETNLSTVSLAWKFRSMYKYRACFGF